MDSRYNRHVQCKHADDHIATSYTVLSHRLQQVCTCVSSASGFRRAAWCVPFNSVLLNLDYER
jgi:hypothetical protein